MFISQGDTRPASQPNCEAAMFGMTFFALLSVFIRALFSVHLHAVIVHDVSKLLRYEKRYIALSFAVALLLALLPMTRYAYVWIDYDPTLGSGHCSYFSLETIPHSLESMSLTVSQARRAVIAGILWCWATYFGWVALTVAYCALVIVAVIVRLWKERRRTAFLAAKRNGVLAANSTAEGEAQPISDIAGSPEHMLVVVRSKDAANVWPMAKKLLRRVAQFPATIILCHSLEVAWATATLARVIPVTRAGVNSITSDLKQLYMCMQIMISLQGVLTLLSLCLEPAIESLIAQWWRRYKCSGRYASTQQKASPSEPSAPHTQTSQNTLTKIEDLPWDIVICKPSALDDFCRDSGN
ncbi:hypothetical protein GGF46_002732 [Coemansia sp. RSA 552]|nr:hypothetical protein GGF46_002732 [Coemansia sp. RSA 552]